MTEPRPLKGLTVDVARARMLAEAHALPVETVPLADADGRVLAEDILATRDQPPFAASAMDGWAVRRADAAEGAVLAIVGESAAGRGHEGTVGAGQAVRIFTGAALPKGADLVVIQEEAERSGDTVRLSQAAGAGSHIRPAGGDFRCGDTLLTRATRLDPWRLSLAAAAGRASLSVARQPRVAILATGEELAAPGGEAGPFQIYESGSTGLAAMIRRWGGLPLRLTPTGDNLDAISAAVAAAGADLIVTIGGASVGDYDLVKPALGRLGLALEVETINVRPGKPTWFGVLADGRRVLGLPGNPASAFVCAELFLRPLIAAMQGQVAGPVMERARLIEALPANGPREHWMRAVFQDGGVRALPDQDSSLVTVFAAAGALLRRPPKAAPAEAGEVVEILRLDRA
jgi:molybdopterin molybdotransferase